MANKKTVKKTANPAARKKGKAKKARNNKPSTGKSPAATVKRGYPIVGIGASAGGLEALEELLDNMPSGDSDRIVRLEWELQYMDVYSCSAPGA